MGYDFLNGWDWAAIAAFFAIRNSRRHRRAALAPGGERIEGLLPSGALKVRVGIGVAALAVLVGASASAAERNTVCADWKARLPRPIYDERPELVEFYDKAWEIAHTRIDSQPGLPVPRYMDEGHRSDWIWIWDTCFMVHFTKYGSFEFPGVESLGNFYGILFPEGELKLPKVVGNRWNGTQEGMLLDFKLAMPDNPPLFAWAEYRHALQTGDRARLALVYSEKRYLQRWFELFENMTPADAPRKGVRAKPTLRREGDLGYRWTGGRSGMDNTPRGRKGSKDLGPKAPADCPNNPDLLWVDAYAQQALAALSISRIAELLGDSEGAAEWRAKYDAKKTKINELYWDEEDGFYYDILASDRSKCKVPTIASYWPLLAEVPSPRQRVRMIEKLRDDRWFGGAVPLPSLARKDADFWPTGGYWRGGVWMPTAYMTLKGLDRCGEHDLVRDLAKRIVGSMCDTWKTYEPHTIWEAYSPTEAKPSTYAKIKGVTARPDFCGWSALGPVSIFIEDIIGIKEANAFLNELTCEFAREIKGRAGVANYRFGKVTCSVVATTDRIEVESDREFLLRANGRNYAVRPGKNVFDRTAGKSHVGSPAVNPLDARWTFGAHEPMTMYRRMGRRSTGAIDGNARWTQDWLDWFDSHAPEKMEEMGFNWIHSRFYKGMGWETERKDFPNVKRFVANCHAHGVRTLAYVQFGTLYPEMMRGEIPAIDTWCGRDSDGRPNLYTYYRWMPCLTCREWEDYLKRMCTIALAEGGFDGIMFDNVFDKPCYCARCRRLFGEWLAKVPDLEGRFGLTRTDGILLPPVDLDRTEEIRDPVEQAWFVWRCETMTGLLTRLRSHIKSVRPDAVVSGNPSPYRSIRNCEWKAQNMIELSEAFDLIVMQNANYPEVKGTRIRSRARDFKLAQDLGQTLVALCDSVESIYSDREKKFIFPMLEDVVFGGIPTDRTSLFPAPEEGFVNSEVWTRRKPIHRKFNAFVDAHRAELSAPTVHSVRIFYPEREILLSESVNQGIAAAEEIFLRNRVPYGYLISYPNRPLDVPAGTEAVVVPGVTLLSDRQIAELVALAKRGMKMVVTGDAGRYDEWNAQRRTNPFLPQLGGIPNVVCRARADRLPKAEFGWGYTIDPPTDGGAALMADLAKAGWRAPVAFEGLPPHVFAEYRRLADGSLAVHLLNYRPEETISGAKATFAGGPTQPIDAFREYALLRPAPVAAKRSPPR